MEDTKIVINSTISKKYNPDITIFCIGQKGKDKPDIPSQIRKSDIAKAADLGDFKGNDRDVLVIYNAREYKGIQSSRVAFIGIGKISEKLKNSEFQESMRTAGGQIAALCRKIHAESVCIIPPQLPKNPSTAEGDFIRCLTEGLLLGDYSFEKYKTDEKSKKKSRKIKEIRFLVSNNLSGLRKQAKLGQTGAVSACHARDMANEPGNGWTAASFADYAKKLANKYSFKCTIFNKKQLEKMGMGGILAVNKGSDMPPKLVVLEHHVSKKAKTVLLVGKGLTFDSGGISIKPAAGMEEMKYDMCGGAAALATMNVVGAERIKCNVVAIVPTTDNMPGSSAVKPADIIYHYNGTTSEIINTDAEGRLILADALSYGIEKYLPDYVIDLATLTGAVIIGLGHHHTGLFTNNDSLAERLVAAGKESGEPLWRLPLGKDYQKQLESKVADMKNTGGKAAGAITAAEYLHAFVGDTPWAHLDIAGTAWNFTEKSYIPDGAPSGIGVRTLAEFIRKL